jgi:hypothetical protein
MKGIKARFISTLNTSSHALIANVAQELPATFWDFLDLHDGLHEGVIA